jgi:radical SAM protein with 4Fe4S-binding SPASM domain
MSELGYTQFSTELHRKAGGRRIPLDGTIEVTHRCPLTCSHCYNNLPMNDAAARDGELDTDEHRRILDEIAAEGCLWLLYTGGEIFARRDFLEIYTHAKRNGMILSLFTNGTLITPSVADYLARWRPFSIEITLYGRTRDTYERLTGIPGSFDRCMRGIRLLLERDLPLELKTVALSNNGAEAFEMQRFVRDELGVPFKFDAMINPRIDLSRAPLALRQSPAQVVAMDLTDDRRMGSWRQFCDLYHGPVHLPSEDDHLYHCAAGLHSFSIDPQGRMSSCVLSNRDTWDLRRGSFRDGWSEFLLKVYERKTTRETKCSHCHIKAMCGMCPANGELESGDPESPVDFLCHVAHLRASVLGVAVPSHGDCEYCPGGSREGELRQSLEEVEKWVAAFSAPRESAAVTLPVLDPAVPVVSCRSKCGSCASQTSSSPAGL